jgi:hypothetical protein
VGFGVIITKRDLELTIRLGKSKLYGLYLVLYGVSSSKDTTALHAPKKRRRGQMAQSGHSRSKSNTRKGNNS